MGTAHENRQARQSETLPLINLHVCIILSVLYCKKLYLEVFIPYHIILVFIVQAISHALLEKKDKSVMVT
jgi:hypothetical protein